MRLTSQLYLAKITSLLLTTIVKLYRYLISPALPRSCRYLPSCSCYTIEAIQLHGPWYGSLLGLKRILRCRPGAGFGLDPVPTHRKNQ